MTNRPTTPLMIQLTRPTFLALLAATTLAACGTGADAPAEAGSAAPSSLAVPVRGADKGDADMKEINSYRLTMDDVRKWTTIKKKADAMKIEASDDDGDGDDSNDDSLDGFERKLNASPKLRALIESEGLDTREFAVITWTFIQAGFIQMAVDQGASMDSLAHAANVNVENLRFLKQHEKEIDALK